MNLLEISVLSFINTPDNSSLSTLSSDKFIVDSKENIKSE